MAKYLKRDATTGRVTEEATVATSAGGASIGKVPELDASGKLDQSMMPSGMGADTFVVVASEALSAGDFVNLYDSGGGVIKARKAAADASGKECDGFVLAAVANAGNATVYFEGQNNQRTGLTPGARYYLNDATPGSVTLTPVSGTGKVHQYIGKAVSAVVLQFEPDEPITLA
jgi:hypothetical protein